MAAKFGVFVEDHDKLPILYLSFIKDHVNHVLLLNLVFCVATELFVLLNSCLIAIKKQVSMTRKCHKQQTNTWQQELETQNRRQ